MTIQDEVKKIIEGYQNNVKPLILEKRYFPAYIGLSNLCWLMERSTSDIVIKIHSGGMFISSATVLCNRLEKSDEKGIEGTLERFEAYAAQTKLPLRPLKE